MTRAKQPKPRMSFSHLLKRLFGWAVFIIIFALLGYATILFGGKWVVDDEKMVLDATTTIETADGDVIGELYQENRVPVDLGDLPEHVKNAFIAIEDRRFYEHAGVDLKSVMRAVFRDIIAMEKVEGASTITQQLAKNLFLYNDKTWLRKTKEAMAAIYLERKLTKNEILELYINQMYFGHNIYGIERASQTFFSKHAHELTVAEGALLAGLAKSPNGYSPIDHPKKALKRRNIVLQAMEESGMLSTEKRLQEQGKTLGLDLKKKEMPTWAASYTDLAIKEAAEQNNLSINELKRGGYRIVVNMDEQIQKIAYEQFQDDAYFPGNTEGVEGAFVMMDQASGNVVAAIGGRNYELGDLNRLTVSRQPGSTIKPLAVYGPALMRESYHPYSLLVDQKLDYDGYTAKNYDDEYAGTITLYDALVQSKNAATVWLLDEIGVSYAKKFLKQMHINIPDQGLAMALGGLSEGLTPMEVLTGYRTFAHAGKAIKPQTIDRIYDRDGALIFQANPEETDVFSPQVAWTMTKMLERAVEEGTAQFGDYGKALAGKTGSTQHPLAKGNVKDAWFAGFTPDFVTALWIGYDRSDREHYLLGGSEYPTKLTKAILREVDKRKKLTAAFEKPDDVADVPSPIELPKITNLKASYTFGGFSLVKGKLSWTGGDDDRIVYRVYRETADIDERVGEVKGETEFTLDNVHLFQSDRYYVVPYDPLTQMEGERSETVELSWS